MIISCSVLRMRIASNKICRENDTYFTFSKLFPENPAFMT